MLRYLVVYALTALVACGASMWWLHDGDLEQAVEPVFEDWDAVTLARDAGIEASAPSDGTADEGR